MSRSGYVEDGFMNQLEFGRWRGAVRRAIRGQRGQAFLRDLAREMDAMPVKTLIDGDLITSEGDCCTIGVICKARGLDVSQVDPHDRDQVADLVGIAPAMAAEIEFENDDDFGPGQTPEQRWVRMRKWVDDQLAKGQKP